MKTRTASHLLMRQEVELLRGMAQSAVFALLNESAHLHFPQHQERNRESLPSVHLDSTDTSQIQNYPIPSAWPTFRTNSLRFHIHSPPPHIWYVDGCRDTSTSRQRSVSSTHTSHCLSLRVTSSRKEYRVYRQLLDLIPDLEQMLSDPETDLDFISDQVSLPPHTCAMKSSLTGLVRSRKV